ncbi:hypothetical protein HDC34_001917 [Pseudoclavibacter sp. JAI123]|uniref:hypothetical protein n=1 Tax=Pseudoclavibacter sp. JAI123 TaxID=2723065 RepID=UPI0015CAB4EB|nr:hypothetical protein [Pseudoclavibacter sp. JAI123]NYF13623.1 hypothetical protein [Pseudoclavibacter sp. JAI123]
MSYPIDVGPFEVYNSDTFTRVFGFERNDAPLEDLADWTNWRAQWRGDDEGELVELTITVFPLLGTVTVSAPAALVPLMHSPGQFDVKATRGTEVRTWIRGETYWRSGVTRDLPGEEEL